MLHDISNVSAFKVLSCACYLLHAEFPSLGAATTISRQSAQSIIQIVYLLGKYIIQETVEVFYLVYSSKDFNLGQTIPDVWSAEMLKLSIIAKQSPWNNTGFVMRIWGRNGWGVGYFGMFVQSFRNVQTYLANILAAWWFFFPSTFHFWVFSPPRRTYMLQFFPPAEPNAGRVILLPHRRYYGAHRRPRGCDAEPHPLTSRVLAARRPTFPP